MGLRSNDLKDLVYYIFEIDEFKSKMGDDKDIATLSFRVKDKAPAEDLVRFLENGYDYILDADATIGEQSDGCYRVFVEIERSKYLIDQILEIVENIGKLTGSPDMKFRYYKNFRSFPANREELEAQVPTTNDAYELSVNENSMNNFKNFFNRSFVEDVDMLGDTLRIKKKWAESLYFKVINFGRHDEIMNSITETINFNDWPEVIYLTKYIGDYNITKFGKKITIENYGHTLVVERIS